MSIGPYPWAYPRNTSETIARQTEVTYLNYERLKAFKDLGYFLYTYVVSGGVVTKDIVKNNEIDVTDIVVSIADDILYRAGTSFNTRIASTTYYLDFTAKGDFAWGTTHPEGTAGEDYVYVATVTTDENANVNVITDMAVPRGGFITKPNFRLLDEFDVSAYGAKGDGVTNDSTSISQAIVAANLSGGGKVFLPRGTYIIGDIDMTGCKNIYITGSPGTVIRIINSTDGFNLTNTDNIVFDGLEIDGTLQTTGTRYMIHGDGVSNSDIKNMVLHDGFHGVFLSNVTNVTVEKCTGFGFDQWPFYVAGCNRFYYLYNISHNNGYDGLKAAGLDTPNPANIMTNMEVIGNICYNNGRDGLDIAGNNLENIIVSDNIFTGNSLYGLECKVVYQGSYSRNIQIINNKLINNSDGGMNYQGHLLGATVTVSNIRIAGNQISSSTNSGSGIRATGLTQTCEVCENAVNNNQYGIRLVDSDGTDVHHNKVLNSLCCQIEVQSASTATGNRIHHNDFRTNLTSVTCINVSGASVQSTEVYWNINRNGGATFRITDTGTSTIMYMNEGGYATTTPTGRATKGEIWWNNSPDATEYMGWVAVTTGGSPTYKGFGAIQA